MGVWCGVVWCGVVWCGMVWCGVVWCGGGGSEVICHHARLVKDYTGRRSPSCERCCDLSEKQEKSSESSKFKTTNENSRKRSRKSQERNEGPPSKKARERPEVAYYKKMEEPDEYKRNIKSRIEFSLV